MRGHDSPRVKLVEHVCYGAYATSGLHGSDGAFGSQRRPLGHAFAEKPLDVYEGETELKVLLKAAKSSKPGNHSLAGKLRIQACDDQVCYPPGSLEVMIPVMIT